MFPVLHTPFSYYVTFHRISVCSFFFPVLTRWFYWKLDSSDGEDSACNVGDLGLIPGLGKSPGEGNGNLLQYSHLENSTDRGAWWAAVSCGVTKSRTRLSDLVCTHAKFMFQCYPPNLSRPVLLQLRPHSWVFFFFYMEFYELFVILQINSLFVASFANIFSHSVCCLFISFIVSFAVQKLLILIRSHLFVFIFFIFIF